MTSKYKDGDHIALYFEDYPGWELVKGWHDAEHCQAELLDVYGDAGKLVTHVTQKYGFWGVGRDEMGDPVSMFYDREEPGRGRFKVTLAHVGVTPPDLAG
jgi:hypothetical protein